MTYTKGEEWKCDDHGVLYSGNTQIGNIALSSMASFGKTDGDNEANKALITAAPEMLEALKDAYDFLKAHGYRTDIIQQAIEKAEGVK